MYGICSKTLPACEAPNQPITIATNPPSRSTPPPIISTRSTTSSEPDFARSFPTPSASRSSIPMLFVAMCLLSILERAAVRALARHGLVRDHLQDPARSHRRQERERRQDPRHRLARQD